MKAGRKTNGHASVKMHGHGQAVGGKKNGFPHSDHLTGIEFLKVMAKGEKTSCISFHLYYRAAEEFQAGVSVSRKLGGAVVRNRIKRVLREAIRLTRNTLRQPCHLVLVAREGAESLEIAQAKASLKTLYGSARLAAVAKQQ